MDYLERHTLNGTLYHEWRWNRILDARAKYTFFLGWEIIELGIDPHETKLFGRAIRLS